MTARDQGRRKPRTAIAAPTMANQAAISTNRAGSMTRGSLVRLAPAIMPAGCATASVASVQAGPAVTRTRSAGGADERRPGLGHRRRGTVEAARPSGLMGSTRADRSPYAASGRHRPRWWGARRRRFAGWLSGANGGARADQRRVGPATRDSYCGDPRLGTPSSHLVGTQGSLRARPRWARPREGATPDGGRPRMVQASRGLGDHARRTRAAHRRPGRTAVRTSRPRRIRRSRWS